VTTQIATRFFGSSCRVSSPESSKAGARFAPNAGGGFHSLLPGCVEHAVAEGEADATLAHPAVGRSFAPSRVAVVRAHPSTTSRSSTFSKYPSRGKFHLASHPQRIAAATTTNSAGHPILILSNRLGT
jgi:hypothetical protein